MMACNPMIPCVPPKRYKVAGPNLTQAQGLREAVAGLRAQLQDARRDEAAASATRDILADQLHAATDAMAEQVTLAHDLTHPS